MTARITDVPAFINARRLSAFQIVIVALCFLITAVDGFDSIVIGYIGPAIKKSWSLSPAQLGPLFGAGTFGLMIGSLIFGPLADRLGRKSILVVSVLMFGLLSLASAWAPTIGVLVLLRFLTGLGLGGAMPNGITMTSEYCPERLRSLLVTAMFCGFTAGAATSGLVAANMIAAHGWRSVLVLGGILPLALVPVMLFALPESIKYLVQKNKSPARVTAILTRIDPQADLAGTTFTVNEPAYQGFPVSHLFKKGLFAGTVCLWITYFADLLVLFFLNSWLPTLMHTSGFSMGQAALFTAIYQIGGTLGAVALGYLMDRGNRYGILSAAFLVGGLAIACIGHINTMPVLLGVAMFLTGIGTGGAQTGAHVIASGYYPTVSRATGVSWALGIGRIGSIGGATVGGFMMAAHWTLPNVFLVVSLPLFVAAVSIVAMGKLSVKNAE